MGSSQEIWNLFNIDNCDDEVVFMIIYQIILLESVLEPGETVWTSERSTWSGRRNLIKAYNNDSTLTLNVTDVRYSLKSQVALQSSLPPWCSFVGKTRCTAVCRAVV